MSNRRRLANFLFRRSWRDKALALQAYILLGLAWLAIRIIPMRKLAGWMGGPQETPLVTELPHLRQARRVAWAIRNVSPYTPWTSNCYPQALTAKYLLRRRGIPCTLYLGAAFKEGRELEAHAWLRCGPFFVTGGPGHEKFGVVGVFGDAR